MSTVVVIVPKYDEFQAIRWAFGFGMNRPDETLPSGTYLFRRDLDGIDICFSLMDSQNNTNSAVSSAEVFVLENPRYAFLAGTALGRSDRVKLGNLVLSKSVEDIVERRLQDRETRWQNRGIGAPSDLSIVARNFAQERFRVADMKRLIGEIRATFPDFDDFDVDTFIDANSPRVHHETIASGNDYFMDEEDPARELWDTLQTARAYDMESAGFAAAARSFGDRIQWLVVRGISDYGTQDSRSDHHRMIATALAGRFIRDLLLFLREKDMIEIQPSRGKMRSSAMHLYTLEDHGIQRFGEMVKGAAAVQVLSRTAVNLIGNYRNEIVRLVKSGATMHIIVVDPSSIVSRHLYGGNPELFEKNLVATIEHLAALEGRLKMAFHDSDALMQVKFLSEFPPFSMTRVVRAGTGESICRVQLNFLYTLIGRDRPMFDVPGGTEWEERFAEEWKEIWEHTAHVPLGELAKRRPPNVIR